MSESRCFVAGRFVMADGAGSGDNHDRDGDTFVISKPLLPNSGFDLLIWRRKRAVWLKTMMMMMMMQRGSVVPPLSISARSRPLPPPAHHPLRPPPLRQSTMLLRGKTRRVFYESKS